MNFRYLTLTVFITAVLLLIVEWFRLLEVDKYITVSWLLFVSYICFLTLEIIFLFKNGHLKEILKPYFKYGFFIFTIVAFIGAPELGSVEIIKNYYFIGALLAMATGFYICNIENKVKLKDGHEIDKKQERLYLYGIIGITLLGIFLRIWNLGYLGIVWDEMQVWISVETILKSGYSYMLNNSFFHSMGVVYAYLSSIFALFLGLSEFSIRILSVISFLALFFYSIKILKLLKTDRLTILSFSLFITIHFWFVEMSRWGKFYMFEIMLSVVSLYYFLFYLQSKKNRYLIFSTIVAMLAIGDHPGYVALFVIPIYFLSRYMYDLKSIFNNFRNEIGKIISFFYIIMAYIIFMSLSISSRGIVEGRQMNFDFVAKSAVRWGLLNISFDNLLMLADRFVYLSPMFFVGFLLFFNKKINLNERILFGIGMLMFASSFAFSYFSDARFYFVIFVYLLLVVFASLKYFPSKFRNFALVYLCFMAILSGGYVLPFIDYGDKVKPHYMPAAAINFYPDNKNPAVELNKIINNDDKIVFFGSALRSYPYMGRVKMSQIYEIGKPSNKKQSIKNDWVGYNYIFSYKEIEDVINSSKGDVYVVLTLSALAFNEPYLPNWYVEVLNKYEYEMLYSSNDGVSKLLKIIK